MREAFNYHPTSGKSERETKHLKPLGIKAPLLPARILGQNWLQTQVEISESYLGNANRQIIGAKKASITTLSEENIAIAASTSTQSSKSTNAAIAEVELESEMPQLPQVLQNLAVLSHLVMESNIHTEPAAKENLAQTGRKTVKIAPSDRFAYSPIPVPSDRQDKPNLKLSTSTPAPEAWSSITDLLANVDSADIKGDGVMPENPYLLSQPPIKAVITPQQRSETFTQQITSSRHSSQKPDRRNLELLAKEVYAFIQQQLLIEPFHSQSSSGRLPW